MRNGVASSNRLLEDGIKEYATKMRGRGLFKPRSFKFLAIFPRTVIRWCDGSFDLLHFSKSMKSQYSISSNHKTLDRLELAQRSVEGQNFHRTSVRRDSASESLKKLKRPRL